jgi:hypothetical protein
MRIQCAILIVLTLGLAPAVIAVHAQSTPLPQVYSLTVSAGMTTLNVGRDGSKVSLEQIVPKSDRGPGMHVRQIYDFATHKYWTMPEGEPCIVSAYTSNSLPSMFDPIGGAVEMRAEMAKSKPVALRSETVNGIPTKVYEMPVPEIKGKMRIFLEEKHNFVVKAVIIPAGGKEQTQMEITSLSYEKPAAALLVPPPNCRVQGGESSATGGRAEVQIDASAKGEATLGGVKPAQKGGAAAAPEIEVRGAGVSPVNYTGPAPAAFEFQFDIEASGPVQAQWVLVSQADTAWESGTITFKAAGRQTLKVPVKIGVANGRHWDGKGHLEVVVGARRISSPTLDISADCKLK